MKEFAAAHTFLELVGGGGESVWPLAGRTTFRLGRGSDSDILLPFPWVSRRHAMIQIETNGSCNLIDLGSANGTFVNGSRVYAPTRLAADDRIRIGRSELLFRQRSESRDAPETETGEVGEETIAFLQRGQVTVLVCDIRRFTPLSEEVGAECISSFLARWTKKIDAIVRANGGQVDKFIGDAVLAVWADGGGCDAVRRALLAAVEISIWTDTLARDSSGIERAMTIGAALDTGEAVMGNLGVDGHRDFTIIGDVVNVTFRLQEMTSLHRLDVLVGETAFMQLHEGQSWFAGHTYELRGKSETVEAHSITFADLQRYLQTVHAS